MHFVRRVAWSTFVFFCACSSSGDFAKTWNRRRLRGPSVNFERTDWASGAEELSEGGRVRGRWGGWGGRGGREFPTSK